MNFVTRDYLSSFDTKEEEGVGIIEGRPVVFDERTDLGYFDEIIARTALDKCDLRDVRLCLNHDTSYVYARSRNNNENSTMQIGTDDRGLYFRAKLDIANSPKAQDYYSAVKRGDMDKMSFMFAISDEEWSDLESDHPTRTIRGIERIVEISAVTFPAYDGTSISARYKESLESDIHALESAKADYKTALDSAKRSSDDDLELAKAKFYALLKVR